MTEVPAWQPAWKLLLHLVELAALETHLLLEGDLHGLDLEAALQTSSSILFLSHYFNIFNFTLSLLSESGGNCLKNCPLSPSTGRWRLFSHNFHFFNFVVDGFKCMFEFDFSFTALHLEELLSS